MWPTRTLHVFQVKNTWNTTLSRGAESVAASEGHHFREVRDAAGAVRDRGNEAHQPVVRREAAVDDPAARAQRHITDTSTVWARLLS